MQRIPENIQKRITACDITGIVILNRCLNAGINRSRIIFSDKLNSNACVSVCVGVCGVCGVYVPLSVCVCLKLHIRKLLAQVYNITYH